MILMLLYFSGPTVETLTTDTIYIGIAPSTLM